MSKKYIACIIFRFSSFYCIQRKQTKEPSHFNQKSHLNCFHTKKKYLRYVSLSTNKKKAFFHHNNHPHQSSLTFLHIPTHKHKIYTHFSIHLQKKIVFCLRCDKKRKWCMQIQIHTQKKNLITSRRECKKKMVFARLPQKIYVKQ